MSVDGTPGPKSLDVILTSECDQDCAHGCQNRRTGGAMSPEIARDAVDLLLRSAGKELHLNFVGGEPLLEYSTMCEVITHAEASLGAGKRFSVSVTTNGASITDEMISFLVEHDVEIVLAFDGVEEAHELRSPGTFEALDRLLVNLRERHPDHFERKLRVAITLTSANLPFLSESVAYLLRRGVREVRLRPLVTHDAGWTPAHAAALHQQLAVVGRLSERHFEKTGEVPFVPLRKGHDETCEEPSSDRLCEAHAGESLAVDVDGTVYGCALLARSYQFGESDFLRRQFDPLEFGRLGAGGPHRCAEDETGRIFRDRSNKYSSYSACSDCRFLAECRVCPVSIGHVPGSTDPDRIPDAQCAFNRITAKHRRAFPYAAAAAPPRPAPSRRTGGQAGRRSAAGRLRARPGA